MDKYEALKVYLSDKPRIRYFMKMVKTELSDAVKYWKKDKFAPAASGLSGMEGSEFIAAYEAEYDCTVQHELAEVIEHLDNFVTAHGDDIFAHYEILKKYRKLTSPDKTTIIFRR